MSSANHGGGGYDEHVAVALGFAEWRSGKAGGMADLAALGGGDGDNRLESSEVVWTESIMGRSVAESSDIFKAYINNYVSSGSTPMAKANSDFRYRYGAKTFVDFLLEIRETNAETPELAGTPTQPLQSIKDAVSYMVDLFESIDSNDQLSLEAYATNSRHEENLSYDYRVVMDRLQGLQPGHYDSWTNLGAGIE